MQTEGAGLNLARAERPKNFKEYRGNEKIKNNFLMNMDTRQRPNRPQMILINGRAGNGKTTLARLIAKSYMCQDKTNDDYACGECKSCKSFDDYIETGQNLELMNLKEIDGAVIRRVEDIQTVAREATQPSFTSGWRVWIFDECHKFSDTAQSYLLKLVEEPPEKVLFIFCTTDPEMLLDTLRSRMQLTYDVNLSIPEITTVLEDICKKEGVSYTKEALVAIAQRTKGILRQALNTIESIIGTTKKVTTKEVSDIFGAVDFDLMVKLFNYYADRNTTGFFMTIQEIESKYNTKQFYESAIDTINTGIAVMHSVNIENALEVELTTQAKIFASFTYEELYSIYSLLLDSKSDDISNTMTRIMLKKLSDYEAQLKVEQYATQFHEHQQEQTEINHAAEEAKITSDIKETQAKESKVAQDNLAATLIAEVDIDSLL